MNSTVLSPSFATTDQYTKSIYIKVELSLDMKETVDFVFLLKHRNFNSRLSQFWKINFCTRQRLALIFFILFRFLYVDVPISDTSGYVVMSLVWPRPNTSSSITYTDVQIQYVPWL